MNRHAWMNHLEQPGCGRQSARCTRQSWKSRFIRWMTSLVGGLPTHKKESVGILGCHCEACLTEGDGHENTPQQQAPSQSLQDLRQNPIRRSPTSRLVPLTEVQGNEYYPNPSMMPTCVGRQGRGIGDTEGWPVPQEWRPRSEEEKGGRSFSPDMWHDPSSEEEKGGRSFSPDMWHDPSPLQDAVARDSSASSYFWDRE